TRGVDRQTRSLEAEAERQAARGDAQRIAGRSIEIEELRVRFFELRRRIVLGVDPHEDTHRCPRQPIERDARVLERFYRHLEEEALLRIHRFRFARRNAEVSGVEAIDTLEESAPT